LFQGRLGSLFSLFTPRALRAQEQRVDPRRSKVGVVPEGTWNVGGALRSLGHVGGAQFPQAARDRSEINGERAGKPAGHVNARHGWGWT